mmetsp:Transcript_11042/g.22655  ORF Transcript_11042/g.22655 Transcript_11042/m.22655 type:complete len:313 (-) Transcript_11042:1530-2468(-)
MLSERNRSAFFSFNRSSPILAFHLFITTPPSRHMTWCMHANLHISLLLSSSSFFLKSASSSFLFSSESASFLAASLFASSYFLLLSSSALLLSLSLLRAVYLALRAALLFALSSCLENMLATDLGTGIDFVIVDAAHERSQPLIFLGNLPPLTLPLLLLPPLLSSLFPLLSPISSILFTTASSSHPTVSPLSLSWRHLSSRLLNATTLLSFPPPPSRRSTRTDFTPSSMSLPLEPPSSSDLSPPDPASSSATTSILLTLINKSLTLPLLFSWQFSVYFRSLSDFVCTLQTTKTLERTFDFHQRFALSFLAAS